MKRPATTHAERVEIVEQHLAGETLHAIAESLNLSWYTVRHWWRAFRDKGWAALEPPGKGPPVVGPLGRFPPRVKYVALRLKREHPAWGPAMLRLHMQRRESLQGLALPKNTALWSYLHQFGARLLKAPRPPTKRPDAVPIRAEAPHQCWEMDFKGDEPFAAGQLPVAPLGLTDEASGAPLTRFIHLLPARGNRQGLTMRLVQADLRAAFTTHGRPDALRMDRDPVFVGSPRLEWPGTLLLWLVGLDIQPLINRPYHPTDNTMVERSHRTWKGDVLTGGRLRSAAELEAASAQAVEDRRRYLPSRHPGCHGQPPEVAFPDLLQVRRPYSLAQERTLFDLGRVDDYLAQWEWRRRVDREGKISLADHNIPVGRCYRGQVVKVRFDPGPREFVASSAAGDEITRFTLAEVSLDYILGKGV